MRTHTYPSLRIAVLSVLRINQPLSKTEVGRELNSWRREGLLGFDFARDDVHVALVTMQEEGQIEEAAGTWRTVKCSA